jgi:hypothetical protein
VRLTLLVVVLAAALPGVADDGLVVTAERVLDPASETYLTPGMVRIEGDTIVEVFRHLRSSTEVAPSSE